MGVFELLDRDLLESATSARNAPRPPPLNQEEWLSFLNTEGVVLLLLRCWEAPHDFHIRLAALCILYLRLWVYTTLKPHQQNGRGPYNDLLHTGLLNNELPRRISG